MAQNFTPEFERAMRDRINPAYAEIQGTESWQRRIFLEEIDRLRGELATLKDFAHEEAASPR